MEPKLGVVLVVRPFELLRGFDAAGENPTNPGVSTARPEQATQNPTQVSEADAFVALVGCLNAEQRARLAALLSATAS